MAEDIPTPSSISKVFLEDLPENCPLPGSSEDPLPLACRFYFFDDGDTRNYQSHSSLGKDVKGAGECRGKSISLQTKGAVDQIMTAKRHSYFKELPVALHNIPLGCGKSLEGKKGHVDFWPFKDFSFDSCRVGVFHTGYELLEAMKDD